QKHYQDAVDAFTAVIEVDPLSSDAYAARGLSYANLWKYEQAFDDADKAIELNPENPISYHTRGFTYLKRGEQKRSTADFRSGIEAYEMYKEVAGANADPEILDNIQIAQDAITELNNPTKTRSSSSSSNGLSKILGSIVVVGFVILRFIMRASRS